MKSKFDPDVYEFYKNALEGGGFGGDFTAADLDVLRENEIKGHVKHFEPYEVYKKIDIEIPRDDANPLPVRVYIPESAAPETNEKATGGPVPVMLYFHGGGFIMGGIEDHDPLCAALADAYNVVVAAVEYRLAPEYPFPACIDDAVCAAEWAAAHASEYGADPSRIMAGGDSSGACISAALALLGRDGKAPALSGLILYYGTYGCIDIYESESAKLYGQGDYVLPVSAMKTMMELYVPEGTDPDDIRLNPGRAADLSGLPPALIVSAEFDPLRDDGEEFARRLKAAGNEVTLIRMKGMMHGFMVYWQKFKAAGELLKEGQFFRAP